MVDISMEVAIGQLLGVLDEAFEHPPKPWTYFTDHGADAGFFGALAKLSAADASRISEGENTP